MSRRGSDEASTHVLEAVTIATVMVASIAYVVTVDTPPPETEGQREFLDQQAVDLLAIMNDTPIESDLGTNLLTVSIHECLQNDCSRLASTIEKLLPTGADYGIYLSTKDGLYPVYGAREPTGEAVTARRTFEPSWSYQFLGVTQSVYNPLEDPVVVYGLPVYSGDLIHQGGSALKVTVEGVRADNANYVMKASASTRAVDSDETPTPSATSLYFHAGDGVALASRDVRASTLDIALQPTEDPVPFYVRVAETGGGIVPAGTMLTVQVPHGWTAAAQLAANAADWTLISNSTDPNGTAASAVVAKLKNDITTGFVDLVFDATFHGDATDYYTFGAGLSAGAYAQAQLLTRAHAHATTPAFEVPTVTTSVPRPLGVGATTTWTLAAFSSDAVSVSRVVIEDEEGRAIFGGVSGLTGPGLWESQGNKLVWNGNAALGHDTPLSLTFTVTSSALGGPASEKAPFTPNVRLANYTGRLTEEASPGLYRGAFLPADADYGGYDSSTGAGLRATHDATSTAVYRTTALPGDIDYNVGYVVGLKDSTFGSAVEPAQRSWEPGATASIGVDVQSVMYTLALAGLTPSIDLYVYPPWAGDDRDPIATVEVYNGTLARGSNPVLSLIDLDGDLLPDPTDVGEHTVSLDIPRHWLYGPYVVEARVTWVEQLSAVVGGIALTEEVVRSASVYDYFVVRPTGDDLPASALYDVHLVTWFEDWG